MAARLLVHRSIRSSATANTAVSVSAVPTARAFVGRVIFEWDSSASGTCTIYAGASASAAATIYGPVTFSQGSTFEQMLVLLAGETVFVSVSVANAGGVGTVHLMGEEVDN